ncbi:MAG: methyltransferase domain-containing protein [Acidobacteria bacterium]|nr:methyltransferase domain-containing protein [Acidobacteriota bacterium]
MAEWFEDETFWQEAFDFIFSEARIQAADPEVEALLALTGVEPGASVLDLCCGQGRHSTALARRGLRVTGVDRSAFLLGKARERDPSGRVEWVQEDMRRFIRAGAFDLAINLFTSFGYFQDPAENLTVLQNLRASLKPGGTLLLDLLGKEIVARNPSQTWSLPLGGGDLFVGQLQVIPGWERVRTEWLFVRGDAVRRFSFEHFVYSGRELRLLLEAAGFRQVTLYGNLAGDPYDGAATRLLALGRA